MRDCDSEFSENKQFFICTPQRSMNATREFESSMKMTDKMRRCLPKILLLSCIVFVLVSVMIPVGEAVWLDVPTKGTKCVSEEIQSNTVVLGDYLIISEDQSVLPTITVKVTSPYGNSLHHMENVTHGQFAFTTKESGNYLACFWADAMSQGNKNVSINIEWKTGIAAKDWDSIAKKEKIEGVELEIRKLEGAVEAIHENLLYLRNKEAEMRTVSEKTNSRVAWYSIFSLGICIVVSGLQVIYLKQYFERKKLI